MGDQGLQEMVVIRIARWLPLAGVLALALLVEVAVGDEVHDLSEPEIASDDTNTLAEAKQRLDVLEFKLGKVGREALSLQLAANKVLAEQVKHQTAYSTAEHASIKASMAQEKSLVQDAGKRFRVADALHKAKLHEKQLDTQKYNLAKTAFKLATHNHEQQMKEKADHQELSLKAAIKTTKATNKAAIVKEYKVNAADQSKAQKGAKQKESQSLKAEVASQSISKINIQLQALQQSISTQSTELSNSDGLVQHLKKSSGMNRNKEDQIKYDGDCVKANVRRAKALAALVPNQALRLTELKRLSRQLHNYKALGTALFTPDKNILDAAEKIAAKIREAEAQQQETNNLTKQAPNPTLAANKKPQGVKTRKRERRKKKEERRKEKREKRKD